MASSFDPSRLAALLSLDWLPVVLDLYRSLRQLIRREAHEGLYEILEYDSTLELLDVKGTEAVLKKRQRVTFLQDNTIAFEDFVWGDGEVLADYKVSPGVEADRYPVGERWNILISLREVKTSGEVEDLTLSGTSSGDSWTTRSGANCLAASHAVAQALDPLSPAAALPAG